MRRAQAWGVRDGTEVHAEDLRQCNCPAEHEKESNRHGNTDNHGKNRQYVKMYAFVLKGVKKRGADL